MTIFDYFRTISSIPRGSGNEKAISDYMVKFAQELGLEVEQDEAYNVYIYKPASKGYENCEPVILQGHLDIVCEKDKATEFDFEKQGLNLYEDGDWICAKGTTLGADNGVAIAYQMAILADKTLAHPPLEILMTTEEETGMGGVRNMQPEYLKGRRLINLDTDNEGEFLVSCAGGARYQISMPLQYEKSFLCSDFVAYNIKIHKLRGGHSGAEIHHERANANVLMGRALDILRTAIRVIEVNGGTKDNVITRECDAVVAICEKNVDILKEICSEIERLFREEYSAQDPDISIEITPMPEVYANRALSYSSANKLVNLLTLLPNGVVGMSHHIEGLVETSSNIGVVETRDEQVIITLATRSSVDSRRRALSYNIRDLCDLIGAVSKEGSAYPAWVYKENSPLRETAKDVFQKMYNKEAKIMAIHAGLECGFISEKLPGVDIIAFGPDVRDIHSPNERVSISSMKRVYEYLIELLKELR